jgi:hypothetical protein
MAAASPGRDRANLQGNKKEFFTQMSADMCGCTQMTRNASPAVANLLLCQGDPCFV